MKGWNEEHLEAVAKRNKDLFEKDKEQFKNRMFWLGWKPSEVDRMIKYLERRN